MTDEEITMEQDKLDQPEYRTEELEKIEQGDEMLATENMLSLALKRSRTEYAGLSLFNIARIINKELKDQNELEYFINELRSFLV